MKAFFPTENPILVHIQQTFHRRLLTKLQEIVTFIQPEVDEVQSRRCKTSNRRTRKTLSTDLTKLPSIEGKRNSSLNNSHRKSPCPSVSKPKTSRPNSALAHSILKLDAVEEIKIRPPSQKLPTRIRSHSNKKVLRVNSKARKKTQSSSFSKDQYSSEDDRYKHKLVVE